jgi:hypothetical protein
MRQHFADSILMEESYTDKQVVHSNEIPIYGGSFWDYPTLQSDPNKSSCGGVHKKNRQQCIIRDFFNGQLPIRTDLDFLKGGILNASLLHEMLMLKMRRLARQKYTETCVRLLQSCTLDPLLFFGVPIVIAG